MYTYVIEFSIVLAEDPQSGRHEVVTIEMDLHDVGTLVLVRTEAPLLDE